MFRVEDAVGSGALGDASWALSHIDPSLPLHTATEGYFQGSHNIFHTNLHWFGAAAVVELVCIAVILPNYYGVYSTLRA